MYSKILTLPWAPMSTQSWMQTLPNYTVVSSENVPAQLPVKHLMLIRPRRTLENQFWERVVPCRVAGSITPSSDSPNRKTCTSCWTISLPSKHKYILTLASYLIIKSRIVKDKWRGQDVKENKHTHTAAVKESSLPLHFICDPLITPLGIDPQIHRSTAERQPPHQELVATSPPSVEPPTHTSHWGFLHNTFQPNFMGFPGSVWVIYLFPAILYFVFLPR